MDCRGVGRLVFFLGFLGLTLVPGLAGLLWVPLAGTTAQVAVGYCPMARFLRLMPWNREAPLTFTDALRVVVARPGGDGLLRFDAAGDPAVVAHLERGSPGRTV